VIIPAYNAAAYLKEALASVRAQTRAPAEVIVVDNGSTDDSPSIALEAGARLLRLERPNLSAARNAGILAASQPWIALLDADDLWDPEKLAWQWQAVDSCHGVGIITTDFTEFDSMGILLPSFLAGAANYQAISRREILPGIMCCDATSFRAHFLRGNFFAPAAILAHRDLMIDVGLFDEALTHMEDRELWLRMLPRTEVAVIERPLLHTRIHGANWSSNGLKMALCAALIAERVLASPARYPAGAPDYYRGERPRFYLNAGRFAEEAGDMRDARRHYLRAWRRGGGLRALALGMLACLPRALRLSIRASIHRPPPMAQVSRGR